MPTGQVDWKDSGTSLLCEGGRSNGRPMDVHWTGGLDSGTSLVCEGGTSNGHPMDVHCTGGLDRTVGQAWPLRVGCDVRWTGRTFPSGQRILMANLDMSEVHWIFVMDIHAGLID